MKHHPEHSTASTNGGPASRALVTPVSDATFEREVIQSDLPVFVDFWAPWCGPCRMVAPVVEQLAKEYQGRMKFVKLDTERNPGVPSEMGIRSIPTLVIFKGREVADFRVGAAPIEDLRRMVDRALGVNQGFLSKIFG